MKLSIKYIMKCPHCKSDKWHFDWDNLLFAKCDKCHGIWQYIIQNKKEINKMQKEIAEESIQGTLLFINSISKQELALFIINLQKSIDGLQKNNEAFVKAFHELHSTKKQTFTND